MSANFVVTSPHIADLHDSDVETLLDLHLFKHDAWCPYPCIVTPDRAMIGCMACGYFEELRGQSYDLNVPHVRNVPRYLRDMGTAWGIVEAMNVQGAQVRMRFELRLDAAYHCRIFNLKPRLIGEAALQALEIINQAGYLKAREVEAP